METLSDAALGTGVQVLAVERDGQFHQSRAVLRDSTLRHAGAGWLAHAPA